MGAIAQDVEEVIPEAVVTDPKTGLKAIKYNALIAALIESVKDLDKQNSDLREQNAELKREVESLKDRMDRIEKALNK
jgi:predicted RNase H-like nuclease (RuvC/YqgF family)